MNLAQPRRYAIGVPLQYGQYVRSITLDGKDVTNEPLDLTSAVDKTLNIDLSSKAASIRGVVRDASGKPQRDVPVTARIAGGDFSATATSSAERRIRARQSRTRQLLDRRLGATSSAAGGLGRADRSRIPRHFRRGGRNPLTPGVMQPAGSTLIQL